MEGRIDLCHRGGMKDCPVFLAAILLALGIVGCVGVQRAGDNSPAARDRPGRGIHAGPLGASTLPMPPGPNAVPRPAGKAGNLTVLPWAGFKAAVTYTFDDSNSSQIEHYDELQALGVPMTFYLWTDRPESRDPVWARAVKDGHELGNHSKTHDHDARPASIDASSAFIEKNFGVTAWTMASPFGDPSYPPLAATRFLVNRGVVNGLIGPGDNVDPFDLFCWVPQERAPAIAFNAQVNSARSAGKWRVVLVHGFTGGSDGAYQPVDIGDFVASVEYAKSLGDVWLDSMVKVASYWRGRRVFSAAPPARSGQSLTWTWSLPEHFPPGKYLRVKVDGGRLTQSGTELAWNEHGFYEVSLDAESLTLSPDNL